MTLRTCSRLSGLEETATRIKMYIASNKWELAHCNRRVGPHLYQLAARPLSELRSEWERGVSNYRRTCHRNQAFICWTFNLARGLLKVNQSTVIHIVTSNRRHAWSKRPLNELKTLKRSRFKEVRWQRWSSELYQSPCIKQQSNIKTAII